MSGSWRVEGLLIWLRQLRLINEGQSIYICGIMERKAVETVRVWVGVQFLHDAVRDGSNRRKVGSPLVFGLGVSWSGET